LETIGKRRALGDEQVAWHSAMLVGLGISSKACDKRRSSVRG
jgi:hypothetical protein